MSLFSVWRVPVPFCWCGGSWQGCAFVPVMGALFQSRGWLPIMEAPGYFRHPTSILAMQLSNAFCSITLFVQAKKYLARHHDWRPAVHYFEPWSKFKIASLRAVVSYFLWKGDVVIWGACQMSVVLRREAASVFRCLPSTHLLIITNHVILTADINYRDPYRHAIRELERYTSPKKETPQMQR